MASKRPNESAADELAAAKKRALEEAKKAALARLLEPEGGASSETVAESPPPSTTVAPPKPKYAPPSKAKASAEEELPDEVKEMMGIWERDAKMEDQRRRKAEQDAKRADRETAEKMGLDLGLMDYLNKQKEQAVGSHLAHSSHRAGIVAAAAPKMEKRTPQAPKAGYGPGAMMLHSDEGGFSIESDGRTIARAAPKKAGAFLGAWAGEGSGGVVFTPRERERQRERLEQEKRRQTREQQRKEQEKRQFEELAKQRAAAEVAAARAQSKARAHPPVVPPKATIVVPAKAPMPPASGWIKETPSPTEDATPKAAAEPKRPEPAKPKGVVQSLTPRPIEMAAAWW